MLGSRWDPHLQWAVTEATSYLTGVVVRDSLGKQFKNATVEKLTKNLYSVHGMSRSLSLSFSFSFLKRKPRNMGPSVNEGTPEGGQFCFKIL